MRKNIVLEKAEEFSLKIIKVYQDIQTDPIGRTLNKQLLRSATSVGANVTEAQGAQSRKDFIMKMSIAHKEARESLYWIKLFTQSGFIKDPHHSLLHEYEEIIKLLTVIVNTARKNSIR